MQQAAGAATVIFRDCGTPSVAFGLRPHGQGLTAPHGPTAIWSVGRRRAMVFQRQCLKRLDDLVRSESAMTFPDCGQYGRRPTMSGLHHGRIYRLIAFGNKGIIVVVLQDQRLANFPVERRRRCQVTHRLGIPLVAM